MVANGMFQFFLAIILSTLTITSSQAQCLSGINHSFVIASDVLAPNQCTYGVEVCVTVVDPSVSSLAFSISDGVFTDSETVLAPFTANQQVCQDLEIIIAGCNEAQLVNIDVDSSDPACDIVTYNGPLDQAGVGPLAVEFAHLNGYESRNEIFIEWITETESANDYFEIEHSGDGRTFKYIERIDGAGDSDNAIAYKFLHQFPYNGLNYYRIKIVDFSGEYTYSNVISIKLDAKDVINVFPTSVDSELNIKMFNTVNEVTNVEVFNSTGEHMGSYFIPSGDNSLQIPTSNLISGIYYVKIKLQGEGIITKPFVKKTM